MYQVIRRALFFYTAQLCNMAPWALSFLRTNSKLAVHIGGHHAVTHSMVVAHQSHWYKVLLGVTPTFADHNAYNVAPMDTSYGHLSASLWRLFSSRLESVA